MGQCGKRGLEWVRMLGFESVSPLTELLSHWIWWLHKVPAAVHASLYLPPKTEVRNHEHPKIYMLNHYLTHDSSSLTWAGVGGQTFKETNHR